MRRLNSALLGAILVLGIVLLLLALLLVNLQYRSRTLFVEHERAIDIGRKLLDDQAELEYKVRKASLPGNIVSEAEKLGLVPSTEEESITLIYDKTGRVLFPGEDVSEPVSSPSGNGRVSS